MEPSPEQNEIIHSDSNIIVISNPGTGKTTTLSLKVIRLLENAVNPEDILCITFTEKAKKEMFEKITQMAKGKFSYPEIMKLNIHTFHSFAYNYLIDSGSISGDIVGNNVMRFSLVKSFEKNNAFNYSKEYILNSIVPKTENAIRYIKSFGITPEMINTESGSSLIETRFDKSKTSYSLDELKAFLTYFIEAYKDYEKAKENSIDYSDMLLKFLDVYNGKKFQYVLVDEMQDMNELEARIAQMVGNKIFLVGDAKQAIFGFQGGSVKNFQKFKQICEIKLLTLNRRSCQQILDYSKGHFLDRTQDKGLFLNELESFKSYANGQMPKIVSTNAHLCYILKVIEENKEKTIGIITRTNRQIIEISKFLDNNNIKYSSTSSQATTELARKEIVVYLKGLISGRLEDKISATFTIFSPYTLKESFELSEMYSNAQQESLIKLEAWGVSMKKTDLDTLFKKIIFPLSITKGPEWFSTAITIKKQIDQYLAFEIPTREGLFDFISIAEESYIERDIGSKITLTTVHKSKGRDFDIVVYVPSTGIERTSFVDMIVEAVLESNNIKVKDELEEESLRVDFVAFTRAKEKLIIITNDRNARKYHVDNLCETEIDDKKDEIVAAKLSNTLSEAYSLFIAGRFKDSEELLNEEDGWLKELIYNYFKNIDRFSYSMINTDPYEFFKDNIIGIPTFYVARNFGSDVHKALASFTKGDSIISKLDDDVKKAVENGGRAIDQLKKEFPGLRLVAVEKRRELPLNSIIEFDDPSLLLTGYIDAIFQHDSGYIIVDYKTDKNTFNLSNHKRQLAVYRKMHSKLENIPEDIIKTIIVFVSLRGGINTGKFDWTIEYENSNAFATFERHLMTVLGWKKNPNKFIQDLLGIKNNESLYLAIKEKLLRTVQVDN
jgi:DNA helicase-2/ATP-dependent DNA helicase PcrA